jgi:O-antigen/teichoic acid export membrane protein
MLVIASAIGQGLLFLGTLVGAWAFEPSAFGVLGVYVTITLVFGMFATGRLDAAIPIPKRDGRARDLFAVGLCAVPAVAFCSYIFGKTIGLPLLAWADAEVLGHHIWILPAGTLTLGIRGLFLGWATRCSLIHSLAAGRVVNGTTTGLGFILGTFLEADVILLVLAWLAGQIAETVAVGVGTLLDPRFRTRTRARNRRRRILRRFQYFPRVLVWSNLLEQLGPHLPTTLISGFFSAEIAGTFNLMQRLVARPAAVIGSSAGVIVVTEASKRLRNGVKLLPLVDIGIRRLVKIGAIVFIPMAILGPFVLPAVLGPQWPDSSWYLLAILPGAAVDFVVIPLIPVLAILERAWAQLTLNGLRIALGTIAIAASASLGLHPVTMLAALSIAIVSTDAAALTVCRSAARGERTIS